MLALKTSWLKIASLFAHSGQKDWFLFFIEGNFFGLARSVFVAPGRVKRKGSLAFHANYCPCPCLHQCYLRTKLIGINFCVPFSHSHENPDQPTKLVLRGRYSSFSLQRSSYLNPWEICFYQPAFQAFPSYPYLSRICMNYSQGIVWCCLL